MNHVTVNIVFITFFPVYVARLETQAALIKLQLKSLLHWHEREYKCMCVCL